MIGAALAFLGVRGMVAAAAVLTLPVVWIVAHGVGHSTGYNLAIAEQAVADLRAERERNQDDATLARMSDYDLCVASLRRRGMRIDACEQLRGVHPERSEPAGDGGGDPG